MGLMAMVMAISRRRMIPPGGASAYIPRMSHEVHGLAAFYASPTGVVARRVLRAALRRLWPELRDLEVAGVGWAAPYLGVWGGAARSLALVPAPLLTHPRGDLAHTAAGPCAVMPDGLVPLPDLSLDRILLVHALESAANPEALLRECWRVLRDDGRLIVVAPNRLGAWALFDHTPFGQGRPWSRGQVARLLQSRLFRVERMRPALFVPPFPQRWALAGAGVWEATGRALLPRLSGLIVAEAAKDVLGAVPLATGELAPRMIRVPVGGVSARRGEA